jgi:hypothetical protein
VSDKIPQVPQWVWALAFLLGIPLTGAGGSYYGANQAKKDIAALQVEVKELDETIDTKVDALDDKIDKLILQLVRLNPDLEVPE